MSCRYYSDGRKKRFILRVTSLSVTACAVVLVLLMLMPTVSAGEIIANPSYNGMAVPEENANLDAMAKAPTAAFSGTPRIWS